MQNQLFDRFSPLIRSLSAAELNGAPSLNAKLRLTQADKVEVCYAPLEYVNRDARVVIVGITPGRTQWLNALKEVRQQLDCGANAQQALKAAKQSASFSGAMRPNLVSLLDRVGLNRWLKLHSCEELFGSAFHLVQTASVLRNPVFVGGENYNGTPNMTRHPLLREQLLAYFGEDAKMLPCAVFVPLGEKVTEALNFLADQGRLDRRQILDGLPHPSGANAERIAYFLGKKKRADLSAKTAPDNLDKAREKLTHEITALL